MNEKTFIFDSQALLKFFQKEAGHEKIVRLLKRIEKTGAEKCIHVINLGELLYTTKREFGDQKKLEVLANIERLHFTILQTPDKLVLQAAEFKAKYSISYADCFALVSAIENKAAIVTGDPEFKKVEHLAEIIWV